MAKKTTGRPKKKPKKDAAQAALAVVEKAIGGKLANHPKSKPVPRARR